MIKLSSGEEVTIASLGGKQVHIIAFCDVCEEGYIFIECRCLLESSLNEVQVFLYNFTMFKSEMDTDLAEQYKRQGIWINLVHIKLVEVI